MDENAFSMLSEDIVLNMLYKFDEDSRNWACLACVSTKFSSLIHNLCCKSKCSQTIPAIVADLVSASTAAAVPPGGWSSLYKLPFCRPGVLHSGVLLENLYFGLERELGPHEYFHDATLSQSIGSSSQKMPSFVNGDKDSKQPDCCWYLFDDMMFATLCDAS